MAQLVVRNLEDDVKERLRQRARKRGRSMEDEVRDILRNAVLAEPKGKKGTGAELADVFVGLGVDFEIPELRGQEARPAKFGK
jgi:antitoxin FitA